MARRPPWYAFLYTLLGAHGTFWLWIVAIITLWWTSHDAFLAMLNRYPEKRSVADAAQSSSLRRWVVLPGVRVVLDGPLLLRNDEAATEFQGAEILIDGDDPAARFWRTTRAIADVDAGARDERLERDAAALSIVALAGHKIARREAHENIRSRRLVLERRFADVLPHAESSVLLLSDGSAPVLSPSATGGLDVSADPIAHYDRSVEIWRDAVRTHVRTDAPAGLLDPAPAKVVERLATNLEIVIGQNALKIGRTPNDLELYVFCAGALVFLFLATGLYGVVTTQGSREPGSP